MLQINHAGFEMRQCSPKREIFWSQNSFLAFSQRGCRYRAFSYTTFPPCTGSREALADRPTPKEEGRRQRNGAEAKREYGKILIPPVLAG
jgi:hypothetical protein